MTIINVLLMWGGAGSEHEISQISAAYIKRSLASFEDISITTVELLANGQYKDSSDVFCQFVKNTENGAAEIVYSQQEKTSVKVDFVIPCFHGYPGETGDIQSFFNLLGVPYLGCEAEASTVCFNKVTTKLWLTSLGVANTPYIMLGSNGAEQMSSACQSLQQWGDVFIKAASQGSSVGCYQVSDEDQLKQSLTDAFSYSPYVLVEKTVKARELEVAVYEYAGEVIATLPGEILSPEGTFYTYEEKYNDSSQSKTEVVAKNISDDQIELIRRNAIDAFIGLKLRHLSRIDFFLTDDGEVLLNEINTFPGMTPISMFPKMMENHGHSFSNFLADIIRSAVS